MSASRTPVTIWVIYDHPRDFPNDFVARRWVGEEATREIICAKTVNALRDMLEGRGLVRLERHHSDDPVIMETWL